MDTENTANTETAAPVANGMPAKLEDVSRVYFPPEKLGDAQAMLAAISSFTEIRWNFDPSAGEIPDGYGIIIIPLQQRVEQADGKGKMVPYGVAACAVPTLETVANADGGKGRDFIQDSVNQQFATKIGNAFRSGKGNLPFTLADFIESRRGNDALKVFSNMAESVVEVLKAAGMKRLNVSQLRQCLSSKAASESLYPNVKQAFWQTLLERMERKAREKGDDASIFVDWAKNRDQTAFEQVSMSEEDLEGLAI